MRLRRREVAGGSLGLGARRVSLALALSFAALLLAAPTGASAADISFCTFGTGPGQCNNPAGVAVDRSNGRVYVVDSGTGRFGETGNRRVNVFDEDGTFLTSFGTTGSGPGQFSEPWSIAVDNDPLSPAFHDVYVGDSNKRVQRFTSSGTSVLTFGEAQLKGRPYLATGPGGIVFVGESQQVGSEAVGRIMKFSPAGSLLGTSTLALGTSTPEATVSMSGLAVDSNEDAYVLVSNRVQKYELTEPMANSLTSPNAASARALAVGPDDSLYVAEENSGRRQITKRDPNGTILRRFGYGQIEFNLNGLATGTESLFGSEENVNSETIGNKVIRIDQPGPGPLACCLTATLRNTSATLKGEVNAEGKSTTYHFDYITQAKYVDNDNSFEGAISTPESALGGSDYDLHSVEAQIGCAKVEVPAQPSCLEPSTDYRYRLVAINADGKAETESTFTTLPPLDIEEVFATDVGTDAGRLHAVVNPLGIPATGYFEYVDDASYQADLAQGEGHDGFAEATKVPDIDAGKAQIPLGEGEASKEVARELTSLAADTVYHYRFVINNPFATAESDAKVFRTFPLPTAPTRVCPNAEFRTAASAALPECRAYEMVSPVDKNGNDIKALPYTEGFVARLDQSADSGNRFTYTSSSAFGDAQSAPWGSQYMATREEGGGWSTRSLNPPRASVPLTDQYEMKLDDPFKLFDRELSNGWFTQITEPTLDECAPSGYINIYRRDVSAGEYEALLPVAPMEPEKHEGYRLELQGVSSDGSRAVFRANTRLIKDAAKISGLLAYQVYEHVADEGCGELRLISYLPNGKASASPASVGTPRQPGVHRDAAVARAVSSDGSRVFFSLGGPISSGPLYVRVNADQEPSPVSEGKCTDPSLGCTLEISSTQAQFWTAAVDGSGAIYSVGGSLFEFDVGKALAGEAASTLIAEGLGGQRSPVATVAAASENLSRLYFVTNKALGEEGVDGKLNLYLRDGGAIRLVATLGSDGFHPSFGLSVGNPSRISNGVRTTADGSQLAFVTSGSPTGYDNTDAADGRPALEVYLYDAEADKLRCISCNPSGARPRARAIFHGSGSFQVSAYMAPGTNQLTAPRALSADGNRLYFESFEALLPRDTNGKGDVYEWRRAGGEEACEEIGAELYVPSAGGCLSLISSGQSPVDSELADASPDGHDVFIRTQSSLLPQDDGLVDIYDARIGGGFPQPPPPPAACEGEACQGPLSAPDDPTPASSAFEGAGNVKPEPATRCRKGKVRRKGRCVPRKSRKAQKAHRSHQSQKKQKRGAR